MFDTANIMFLVVFIILPILFGVWALLARRDMIRRRHSSRRRVIEPAPDHGQIPQRRRSARPVIEVPAQETVQVRVADVQEATIAMSLPRERRRLLVPRYAGRSCGVVKRLGPLGVPDFTRAAQPRSNVR